MGTDTVPVAAKKGTDTHFPAENRNQSPFSLQSLFIEERSIMKELLLAIREMNPAHWLWLAVYGGLIAAVSGQPCGR